MSFDPNTESTIRQIRQHSRQLVRELDVVKGIYLETGYTFTQCHVLFELSRHGSLNLLDLADQLLIDKSNASRTVKKLVQLGLVKTNRVASDNRQKLFRLTALGRKVLRKTVALADRQVASAIANLTGEEQQTVIDGLQMYASALRKSRLQAHFSIRKIRKPDNRAVAENIRNVLTEFGAVGQGYSIEDAEIDDMYGSYKADGACYYVIEHESKVVGGGGFAVGARQPTQCRSGDGKTAPAQVLTVRSAVI